PMVMYAVLDRIVEEQHAVFLAEKNQVEWVVPMNHVPDSSVTGDWFRLYVIENEVESIERDEKRTGEARKLVRKRLKLLRSKYMKIGKWIKHLFFIETCYNNQVIIKEYRGRSYLCN